MKKNLDKYGEKIDELNHWLGRYIDEHGDDPEKFAALAPDLGKGIDEFTSALRANVTPREVLGTLLSSNREKSD